MGDVKWIKLDTELFNDTKIRKIRRMPDGNDIMILWIYLLLQAGKCNAGGYIFMTETIPLDLHDISEESGIALNTVKLAMGTFDKLEMVKIDEDGKIYINNFIKHQNVDKLEKIREQTRKRVAKFRERQKQKMLFEELNNENDNESNGLPVTQSNALDKNRLDKTRKEYIYKDINFTALLNLWIESGLIKHKITSIKNQIKKRHADAINDVGIEQTEKAIKNYAEVLKNDKYYWTHEWSLWDFIGRGLYKFIDDAKPLENYLKDKTKKKKQTDDYFDENRELMKRIEG